MERKRVVHYAKSRTARVLTPTPTNQPDSSWSLTEDCSRPAPLASVESDVLVITKPRDATNTAPNMLIQIRNPRTSGASSSSVVSTTSRQSALPCQSRSGFRQSNDYRPVHNLSTSTPAITKTGVGEVDDKQRQQWTHQPQRGRQGFGYSGSSSNVRVPDSHRSSGSCTCDTLNLLSFEFHQQKDCPVHIHDSPRRQETSSTSEGTTAPNRSNADCIRGTGVGNVAPSFTPKSRKVFPASTVRNPLDSNVSLSEHRVSVSKTSLSTAPSSKSGCVHKPNTLGPPRDPHGGNIKGGMSRTIHEPRNPPSKNSLTVNKSRCQFQNISQSQALNSRSSVSGASEPCLTQGVTFKSRRDVSYDKTSIPVLSRTGNPAQSGTLPRDNRFSHSRDVDKPSGDSNQRQPSTQKEKAHTLPRYDNRSTYYDPASNQKSVHPKDRTHNTSQPPGRSSISSYSRREPQPKPAVEPDPKLHTSSALEANSNSSLIPEFKPSWKRSSMRMATQGYSSMSDLAASIDSLTRHAPESGHKDYQGRDNNVHVRVDSDIPTRLEHPSLGHTSNQGKKENLDIKMSYPVSEKREANASCDVDKPETKSDKNLVKKKEFKLAPTSISGVWLLEDDMNKLLNDMNQSSGMNTNHETRQRNQCQIETEFSDGKRDITKVSRENAIYGPRKGRETVIEGANDSKQTVIDRSNRNIDMVMTNKANRGKEPTIAKPCKSKETLIDDLDEHLNRLKRRSFMLATTSISDLTCDVDEIELGRYSPDVNDKVHMTPQPGNPSVEKFNSSDNRTPEYQTGRPRGNSLSSGRLSSSFGSYYSCQSMDFGKSRPSPIATPENPRRRTFPSKEPNRSRGSANDTSDSMENDNSTSGDNSSYYTASSASFVTGDEMASRGSPSSDSKQRSPKIPTFHWWRKSPYPRADEIPKTNGPPVHVQAKSSSLPNRGKAPKHSSPISNVLNCYSCGVNGGVSNPLTQGRGQRDRWNSNSRPHLDKQDIRSGEKDDYHRSSSNPPPRVRGRYSDPPPRTQPIQRQLSADFESPPRDDSFTSAVPPSPSSESLDSLDPESSWQERPRSPPSLGRPRRKLYAGFDSQPLPMDSFMSDSSSVYSAVSSGSWSTSKSAEVESAHRIPLEGENLTHNARAVSTSASGARTPTRRKSGDEVLDLFSYTDKRHSLGENNHNLYRSTDNSNVNTCFKDSFYDKTFSNESLISFQSDVTTTGDTFANNDNLQEDLKTQVVNSLHGDTNKFNNNVAGENQTPKRTNETSQHERLNNSRGFDYGSRLSNNCEYFTSTNSFDYNGQTRPLKASLSASAPRSHFLSRRKYFSSKDILDLLMSEKNAVGGATSITSLEKQAQKVCKVILCCNEMEGPRVTSKEYHF